MRANKDNVEKIKMLLRNNRQFTVFDIETTGWRAAYGEMITEIGAVKVLDDKIIDYYHQLVNPMKPIPAEITEITGITDEMVRDMPTIQDVLPGFLRYVGDDVVVAHNGTLFDKPFVSHFVEKYKYRRWNNELIDTLQMARDLLPHMKNHKLNLVAEELGISLVNHHRADKDAEANAIIFIALKKMYEKQALEKTKAKDIITPGQETRIVVPTMQNAASDDGIKSISSWKLGKMNRLYVNITEGTVYYDFTTGSWANKNVIGKIDYSSIEDKILNKMCKNNMVDLANEEIRLVG